MLMLWFPCDVCPIAEWGRRIALPRVRIGVEVTVSYQCGARHTPMGVTIRWRIVKVSGASGTQLAARDHKQLT